MAVQRSVADDTLVATNFVFSLTHGVSWVGSGIEFWNFAKTKNKNKTNKNTNNKIKQKKSEIGTNGIGVGEEEPIKIFSGD